MEALLRLAKCYIEQLPQENKINRTEVNLPARK